MLKDALAGMPTRPVLYLSLTVLVAVLGYHFFTTYQSCRSHGEIREALGAAIDASAGADAPLRLSQITDFVWDRADILVNYKPEGSTTDCPFGWDWSREQREKLIAEDLLTVIVFLKDGTLVNYVEYPRDHADFAGVANPYTPQTANFSVTPSQTNTPRYILTRAP